VTAALSHLDEPEDGRRARRSRSRDLAVDALLDLLDEGVARPTAQQVAERAGVSLRSIFRIFDDVETLHTAAAARQISRIRHLFVDVVATGTVEARVRSMVELNARLYETIAPIRRAALLAAAGSPALQEQLARARGWLRAEVERVFAAELADLPQPATTAAVEAALSFEVWDQLRSAQGLSATRTSEAVRLTVLRLLSAEG
jgi:TetR/AcrR family transcriptional regulator of autoinduction and epiphytic fitness